MPPQEGQRRGKTGTLRPSSILDVILWKAPKGYTVASLIESSGGKKKKRKFWGPEWVGVKPNTKPRKHRGANNTKPDLERTGQR